MGEPETAGSTAPAREPVRPGTARPGLMLALATIGFAVNFWAWALLSPLGPRFKDVLQLSPFQGPCPVGTITLCAPREPGQGLPGQRQRRGLPGSPVAFAFRFQPE